MHRQYTPLPRSDLLRRDRRAPAGARGDANGRGRGRVGRVILYYMMVSLLNHWHGNRSSLASREIEREVMPTAEGLDAFGGHYYLLFIIIVMIIMIVMVFLLPPLPPSAL